MGLDIRAHDDTDRPVMSDVLLRSDGPLSTKDFDAARKKKVRLGFDPVQNGWVFADAIDDIDSTHRRPGWELARDSRRVSLRQWTNRDARVFRSLLGNPNVWVHLPQPFPGEFSLEMAQELIALSEDTQLHIVRAICVGDQPVGQVRLAFDGQEPELSYWLGEPFWRKGIAYQAVVRFINDCFDADCALDHMIARVRPENIGSIRILEKSGFIREGRSNAAPDWIVLRRDRTR